MPSTNAPTCRHHYLVGEGRGLRKVVGRCKHCGLSREFKNIFDIDHLSQWQGKGRTANPSGKAKADPYDL